MNNVYITGQVIKISDIKFDYYNKCKMYIEIVVKDYENIIVYIPENIVLYCLKKIKKFDEIYVFGSLEIVNKNISENCAYDNDYCKYMYILNCSEIEIFKK